MNRFNYLIRNDGIPAKYGNEYNISLEEVLELADVESLEERLIKLEPKEMLEITPYGSYKQIFIQKI